MKKAFDRIEISSVAEALREEGVDEDSFQMSRGVRQGDALSGFLFNITIEMAFRKWKMTLKEHGWQLDPHTERLTNLRFADDIMILGKSQAELQEM
eukprot:5693657-Karenia_brevis.AAC.1